MPNQLNFSKTAIAALPSPSHGRRDTYYDTKIPKLALRVTAAGTKTFYLIKRIDSGMAWLKLGLFPDMAPEQARLAAEMALGAIAVGKNPVEARRALKAEKTFDDLFDEYLKRHATLNKRSWVDDVQRYNRYVKSTLGRKKLSQISRAHVASIHSKITMDGHPTVANRVLALVSSIFGRGIEWGLIDGNPARNIRKNPEKSRDRFLQSDELPRFFRALAEEENHTVRDYVLISLLTGARRSNVLNMRWKDINFERREWRIPITKNGEPQTVTLCPEAIEILAARMSDNRKDYIFPGDGKTGHLKEPYKGWQRIFDRDELYQLTEKINASGNTLELLIDSKTGEEKAETLQQKLVRARELAARLILNTDHTRISDLRIHDLRRTLGSWQAKTGASLAIIGKSLNHKNPSTTAIYARLDLDPVRDSVNTATSAMLAAAGLKGNAEVVKLNHRKGKA